MGPVTQRHEGSLEVMFSCHRVGRSSSWVNDRSISHPQPKSLPLGLFPFIVRINPMFMYLCLELGNHILFRSALGVHLEKRRNGRARSFTDTSNDR